MIENKVIVIDSGISHKYVETHNIKLFKVKNLCCRDIGEIEDKAGHGTSIVNIIHSIAPNSEFLLIKIYDNVLQQSIEVLIDALKYVYDLDIRNSIVHMSVGIDFYSKEIEALCEAICNKSNILIAAFDNMGCISYPASLDCVIGVEGNILCNKISDFIVNQNSIVDVYAKGGNHRVLDKDCLPIIRQGNSYSAAFVTGVLANKRLDGYSKNYALKKLECLSTSRGTLNKNENNYFDLELKLSDKEKDNIGRVGVFPYNKEIKTLVRYADYLEFELVNVYSSKYLRNINIEIYNKNQTVSYIIRDIEDISLSEIDTLIIGHISQLDYLIPNIKQNILLKCLKSNINVYSLDTDLLNNFLPKFNEKDLMIRCPIINKNTTLQVFNKKCRMKHFGV